jgi:hypothetical protein
MLLPHSSTGQAISSEFGALLLTLEGPADDEHLTKEKIFTFMRLSAETIAILSAFRKETRLFDMTDREAGSNFLLES